MTNELIKTISMNSLYKQIKKYPLNENIKYEYTFYKNTVTHSIKKCKFNYCQNLIKNKNIS